MSAPFAGCFDVRGDFVGLSDWAVDSEFPRSSGSELSSRLIQSSHEAHQRDIQRVANLQQRPNCNRSAYLDLLPMSCRETQTGSCPPA